MSQVAVLGEGSAQFRSGEGLVQAIRLESGPSRR